MAGFRPLTTKLLWSERGTCKTVEAGICVQGLLEVRSGQCAVLALCEDRVLEGPASGEKGSQGGPYMYCHPRP